MSQRVFAFDPPLARNTDPSPSHIAAAAVQPKLGFLCQMFLDVLRRSPEPMTAREVERAASGQFIPDSLRKRAAELVRKGAIVECGSRGCRVSGALATTYRISRPDMTRHDETRRDETRLDLQNNHDNT